MALVDAQAGAEVERDAVLEQRQVEAHAVVAGASAEPAEVRGDLLDVGALATEVEQRVLPDDELAVGDLERAEQENVRAGAAGETAGFGVEEQDLSPLRRCFAAKAKLLQQHRIRLCPPNHAKPEVVEREVLLAGDERELRSTQARQGVDAAAIATRRGDPGEALAKLHQRSRTSTSRVDVLTSAPSAAAGPTQDGQPSSQPHPSRCSSARCSNTSRMRKRRSAKPIPPGMASYRYTVGAPVCGERTSEETPRSCGSHIRKTGAMPWSSCPNPAMPTSTCARASSRVPPSVRKLQNAVVRSSDSGSW